MKNQPTLDQLKYLLTFPFQDEKWISKLLIASLLLFVYFIPILPAIIFLGYLSVLMKNVLERELEPALPEWEDWEKLFRGGGRLFAVSVLVFLPVIAFILLGYGAMVLPVFSLAENPDAVPWGGLMVVSSSMVGMMLIGIAILLFIVLALFGPVAGMHVIAKERFSAFFEVGEWWAILRANSAGFLLTYVMAIGLALLGMYALQILYMSVVLCCLIPFLSSAFYAYIFLVCGGMFAQAYRVGQEKIEREVEA